MSYSVSRSFQSPLPRSKPVTSFKSVLDGDPQVLALKGGGKTVPAHAPSTGVNVETRAAQIVKTAPRIPAASQVQGMYGYHSLADYMRHVKTIEVIGNTLVVIAKDKSNYVDLKGLKADIKAALAKGSSLASGKPLAKRINEHATFPLVIEIGVVSNEPGDTACAEMPLKWPQEKQKPLFKQNFDLIHWNPKSAALFQKDDGQWIGMPTWIILFHELGHLDALRHSREKSSSNLRSSNSLPYAMDYMIRTAVDVNPNNGVMDEEDRNLPVEQQLAKQAGLQPRQKYNSPVEFRSVRTVIEIPWR